MDMILSQPFLTSLIAGLVISGVPLLLAGLGEQISEKAGVLNIGIEGMMLTGAYAGFLGAYQAGSLWVGFLYGMAGGAAVALVMAGVWGRGGGRPIVLGLGPTPGGGGGYRPPP